MGSAVDLNLRRDGWVCWLYFNILIEYDYLRLFKILLFPAGCATFDTCRSVVRGVVKGNTAYFPFEMRHK